MFKNKITLDNRDLFNEYLFAYDYKASGLSFTSLYMWRDINNFKYEIINGFLCICGDSQLEYKDAAPFMLPPLSKTGTFDSVLLSNTIDIARKKFEDDGFLFNIRILPFHMVDILEESKPNEFSFIADRPNYDYVYLASDLIELKGKKLHSKKNHLNAFKRENNYEFLKLTADMVEECIELNSNLNSLREQAAHEKVLIEMEEKALEDVMMNFEAIGFFGGVIKINGKIEAFSLGGKLSKKSIVVHIEKANPAIRGLYQAINNDFSKCYANNVKYVNREEDMGLMGLRKAKSSYKPVHYVEKYIAIFKMDL